MANRRMIASDIFEDDFYINLDMLFRNLWIGLIVRCADDQGRIQDNGQLIKSQVFPADNVETSVIETGLNLYAGAGKIHRYQVGGKRLIQIVNWWRYQTPQWANKSKYPAPDGWHDREKYHAGGSKIVVNGWDMPGGFDATIYPATQPPTHRHTNRHTNIDTNLVTNQHTNPGTSPINDGDGDGNGNGNGDGDGEGAGTGEIADKKTTAAAAAAWIPERPNIYRIYEREIGPLTPMIATMLDEIDKTYPDGWFESACGEAVANNAHSLRYVQTILNRWQKEGFGHDSKPKATTRGNRNNGARYDTSELDELIAKE